VTSWGACDKAARIAIGQCVSMIDEDRQCSNWGVDRVDDRAYCGQHLRAVFLAADTERRETARKADVMARIDAYMAWTAAHPSISEPMPIGWQP
jgi:hypothetical protein